MDSVSRYVYRTALDSLTLYTRSGLKAYGMQRFSRWRLDSLVCMNMAKDKAVMVLLNQESEHVNNALQYFYGVKIDKQWYYFTGSTLYTNPYNHQPQSFTELHGFAVEHVFRGYLHKDSAGQWHINERFFERMYQRDAYNYPFTTQQAWEESWLRLMHENWQQRETHSIKP